ncbi:hypothetical protein M422DRAFT_171603 [Sphaerobolus stellatus SS14]|uniref:NACHT domain-containing protein n=1 Tax=Sphaerobolus stellatus (strain SS14) TaxID=990650 RepID=A0A0C9VV58_SPHS4|nr:hypothetical protein M422DRAFT_171603 [Sphaerobolus stellatus SS14]
MIDFGDFVHVFGDSVDDAATPTTKILPSRQETLHKIMEQIIDCSEFISRYYKDPSFALRAVKHIFSDVDDAIKKYTASFKELKAAFTDATTVSTQLSVIKLAASIATLHSDVNLNNMSYAKAAGYKSGEVCIPGTRVKVLDDIACWAVKEDIESRICLLLGPAGAGKSAIAHSIARIFDDLGRLGSSFFFIRGDQDRHLKLYLPTLARDLADRDLHIKESLGKVLNENSRGQTDDLGDQFKHLIAQTVKECSIIGPILLVIDALDECGERKPRKDFLKLLTNPETMKKLPSNFRIFITSRPDQDIQELSSEMHILQLQDKQYKENVDNDILSFVSDELQPPLQGITEADCKQIVKKSEGLFQWASVACQLVQAAAESGDSQDALTEVLNSGSGLYELYTTALNYRFQRINVLEFSQRFKRVLGFILGVSQPLSKISLSLLWRLVFGKNIAVKMDLILPHLGSLFNGISDTAVVSPIHTSVRDFFTSPEDSGAFFINTEEHHCAISLGLLHVLNTQLCFNICQIQTSYTQNSDIKELNGTIQKNISPELSYACQFLGTHLQKLSDADKQDKRMHTLLREFLEKKLLFWFEALGLLKKIDCAMSCLSEILPLVKFDAQLESLSRDAINFIRMASPVIEEATPHLYLSGFNFVPENSILYKHFLACFSQRAKVSASQEAQWPALEIMLTGHTYYVSSVAFSPDGQRVVSGSYDNTIRIWNAHTGELVSGPFEGHTEWVVSVAFSPDGQRVVSGSRDDTIRIWNAHTGELVCGLFGVHKDWVTSVAFSPDGQRVVSGSNDHTIRIWNAHTGELVSGPFKGHTHGVKSVAFSPDGQRVVSGSSDKTIRIWNAHTGELVSGPFEGHTEWVNSVAFSPDGQRVVSGSYDKTIRIWNAHTGELVSGPFESHTEGFTSVAFSPDGQRVVSGSYNSTVTIWNAHTGEIVSGPFEGHTFGTIRIWNTHTGELVSGPFEGHTSGVNSVGFSPDGQRVVSGSGDSTIRIWNTHTGELVSGSFEGHRDGISSLVSDSFEGHPYGISSVAFSPDGKRVSGSANRTIRIWNAYTRELVSGPFEGHTYGITSVAFSPDGQRVVSGSRDYTIRIWNAYTREIVSGPFYGHTDWVTSVDFSPDGQRVVSGSDDYTIRIWNAYIGELVSGPFEGHTGSVTSVAFSPDGQRVVSGSSDKTIRIWNAHTGEHVSGPLEGDTSTSPKTLGFIISFSPNKQHAINLLSLSESITCLDSISFNRATGWILGPNNELILWIPFSYRERLWPPRSLVIMGLDTVDLDLSQFVHGPSWTDCWKGQ